MAKTKDELIKMNFMQLKNHCKSLNIKIKLGETKASMIKLILAADPPPINSQSTQEKLSKEAQLKQKLIDTDIYDQNTEQKQLITATTINNNNNINDNESKSNTLSLSAARKIVKRYCPRRGQMGMTIYPAFVASFRASQFRNLSVNEFLNALIIGNEKLLGMDNISQLSQYLFYWDDISNNNGWNLCQQQLNGYIPPKDCSHEEALMFSIFNIPHLIPRMRLTQKICDMRENVLQLLYFMDTFNESMKEIQNNDVYSRIFLSTIILSKFRADDITLSGCETYKNIIDFLQKISLRPTAKELFQSKRWNTLKEKGKLVEEINKPQFIMSDNDFNKIREKAIQFGSAIQPQMPRIVKQKLDKKTQQQKIKKDIGNIDTKALQNKLQNALKHKLNTNRNDNDNNIEEKDEKKEENVISDLNKYHKMLSIGVKMDAVTHEMQSNGIPQSIIDQFIAESQVSQPDKKKKLPNALMASINANTNSSAPIPPPAPVPAAAPAPVPTPASIPTVPPPIPPPAPAPAPNGHGISNGMFNSSLIPDRHSNVGLNWKKAINKYKVVVNKVGRLRVLVHGLDIQIYRRDNGLDESKTGENMNEEGDEKKQDFYDGSFNVYIAQINRIDRELKNWIIKSNENNEIMKHLEILYHSKFRPEIFKSLTKSRYNALQEAANQYDEDVFVPDDIIGVIWMFVKPFDELIELKFAVDCINEFFNKDKKEIAVKKLPIQSHRGYETTYII